MIPQRGWYCPEHSYGERSDGSFGWSPGICLGDDCAADEKPCRDATPVILCPADQAREGWLTEYPHNGTWVATDDFGPEPGKRVLVVPIPVEAE